jgi:two-component system nitrogen regulation sensor histidine kinase NtrY
VEISSRKSSWEQQAGRVIQTVTPPKVVHHRRTVLKLAILGGLPGFLATTLFLWLGDYSTKTVLTTFILVGGAWGLILLSLLEAFFRPLQAASNMLSALREGDYSLRPRDVDDEDPLGQIMWEISMLTSTLNEHRMGAVEATLLLQQVMEEIDVAVFTINPKGELGLVNKTGEDLLGTGAEAVIGKPLEELPEALQLAAEGEDVEELEFPGREGRWGMKRGTFREGGEPHTLLLFTDLSRRLREEERQAWKRLIRVIGHEINNSLAPIKSIAGSMASLVDQCQLEADWKEDMQDGLDVIASRVDALSRFVEDYARIARLPPPRKEPLAVGPLMERVAALGRKRYSHVSVLAGPDIEVLADNDQVEQLLINLSKNAIEAAQPLSGAIEMGWERKGAFLEIFVRDEGQGIANPSNIFVPFFSTKPGGSGIGLTLSRQIAEAHGGSLKLDNRTDRSGAVALLTLPLE